MFKWLYTLLKQEKRFLNTCKLNIIEKRLYLNIYMIKNDEEVSGYDENHTMKMVIQRKMLQKRKIWLRIKPAQIESESNEYDEVSDESNITSKYIIQIWWCKNRMWRLQRNDISLIPTQEPVRFFITFLILM